MNWFIDLISNAKIRDFCVTFIATHVIKGGMEVIKKKRNNTSIDWQMVHCLQEAFFNAADRLSWEKDPHAINETFCTSLGSVYNQFSKEGMQEIFKNAVGHDVLESDIACFIECFLIQLAEDEHTKLREYLKVNNLLTNSKVEEHVNRTKITVINNEFNLSKESKKSEFKEENCIIKYPVARHITKNWRNTVKHFLGRNKDINSIMEIMENEHKSSEKVAIWIYSMGGVGKTQLCRKLYSKLEYQYSYLGWIACQGDFRSSLVNSFVYMEKIENLDDAYETAIQQINYMGKNLTLFIDNYDNVDTCIGDIESLQCNVIITSRNKNPDTFIGYELGFLSFKSCKTLFRHFYKIEDNEIMNEIIHKSGYLALAIELLAKTGQKLEISLENFYQKLEQKGFNIGTVIQSNWDNNGEKLNIELSKHFGIVFDLTTLDKNEEAIYILKNFSILPYLGVKQKEVAEWLALDEEKNCLTDLADSGWLQRVDAEYVMHPIISSTVKQMIPPVFSDCYNMINSLTECIKVEAGDDFIEALLYLPYANSVSIYFKQSETTADRVYESLIYLFIRIAEVFRHNGEYLISLEWAYYAEEKLRNVPEENGLLGNLVYNILAEICLDMRDRNEESRDWAICAIRSDELLADGEDMLRSTSVHNLACAYIQMGENQLALEKQLEAVRLRERFNPQDRIRLANSYRNLAMIYRRLEQIDEAYKFQRQVIDILEEVHKNNDKHPDFPVAYSIYSFILRDKGEMDRAIEFQTRATQIREAVNEDNPKLAINYNNLGIFYLQNNNPEEALLWQKKALQMDLKHRGPKHLDVASDYFNLAKILHALGETEKSIENLQRSYDVEKECGASQVRIKEVEDMIAQYTKEGGIALKDIKVK